MMYLVSQILLFLILAAMVGVLMGWWARRNKHLKDLQRQEHHWHSQLQMTEQAYKQEHKHHEKLLQRSSQLELAAAHYRSTCKGLQATLEDRDQKLEQLSQQQGQAAKEIKVLKETSHPTKPHPTAVARALLDSKAETKKLVHQLEAERNAMQRERDIHQQTSLELQNLQVKNRQLAHFEQAYEHAALHIQSLQATADRLARQQEEVTEAPQAPEAPLEAEENVDQLEATAEAPVEIAAEATATNIEQQREAFQLVEEMQNRLEEWQQRYAALEKTFDQAMARKEVSERDLWESKVQQLSGTHKLQLAERDGEISALERNVEKLEYELRDGTLQSAQKQRYLNEKAHTLAKENADLRDNAQTLEAEIEYLSALLNQRLQTPKPLSQRLNPFARRDVGSEPPPHSND